MSDGFLSGFPDLTPLLQLSGNAGTQANALLDILGSLGYDNPSSPIGTVTARLGELDDVLDIDVAGLSTRLPSTVQVISNALPPDTLQYVASIANAYTAAQDFLRNTPLATEIAEGSSLQEVALAGIESALDLFHGHLDDLAGSLIDANTLDQARSVFAAVEAFRSDFPSHRDEFLPFIAKNLIGVSPDLLRDPLNHLDAVYAVLTPLKPEVLAGIQSAVCGSG